MEVLGPKALSFFFFRVVSHVSHRLRLLPAFEVDIILSVLFPHIELSLAGIHVEVWRDQAAAVLLMGVCF